MEKVLQAAVVLHESAGFLLDARNLAVRLGRGRR